MARTRSRTKMHGKEKVTLNFEFDLTELNIYPSFHSGIRITADGNECEAAVKLIKFMYKYLDRDFTSLEKKLNLKITKNGFFDKEGNKAEHIKI